MKLCKKICFMISVFVFVFSFSFSAFAITPAANMVTDKTLEGGPWHGHRYLLSRVSSNGSVSSTKYTLTGWRDGTSVGDAYYQIGYPDTGYWDFYLFSSGYHNNIALVSEDPLVELYVVDSSGTIVADVLESAFITESSGKYFYGVSCQNGTGVALRAGSLVMYTELSPVFNGGSYYDVIANNLPFVGGVYNGNSVAVRYPGLYAVDEIFPKMVGYGFDYLYFPVACVPGTGEDVVTCWNFASGDGVLHSGSQYSFNFKVYNVVSGRSYIGDIEDYTGANISPPNFNVTIDGQETSLTNLGFGFRRSKGSGLNAICFIYQSSSSDDIGTLPPDDSGDGEGSGFPNYSAALSQIGSMLTDLQKAVGDGVGTVVNNITYQTTQITNTITNTVTNMTQQITQGLSDVKQGITDKLQGVEEGITSSIEQANEDLIASDEKLHEEQIKSDQENTEKVETAIEEHGNFIIDGLKSLFIPSDEFFQAYFDDLFSWFSDRFGFLSFPIDLLARVIDLFLNSSNTDCILTLPSFEISGEQLLYEQSFNLTDFLESNFAFVLAAIRMVTSIGLIMAFVNLCSDKWNEVMRN